MDALRGSQMLCRAGLNTDYVHILTVINSSDPPPRAQRHPTDKMMVLISVHHIKGQSLFSRTGFPLWA